MDKLQRGDGNDNFREIVGNMKKYRYFVIPSGHVFILKAGELSEMAQEDQGAGYLRVVIGGRIRLVHRLVAMAFVTQPSGCNVVNHLDEDKVNNYAGNLEWTTQSGNMKYYYRNRRHKIRGVERSAAKLDDDKVREIRRKLAAGEYGTALGREFGVANSTIYSIKNGIAWTHVALEKGI